MRVGVRALHLEATRETAGDLSLQGVVIRVANRALVERLEHSVVGNGIERQYTVLRAEPEVRLGDRGLRTTKSVVRVGRNTEVQ